ncbi:NADPH-dependent oxidoreductase [Gordonia sp. DT101]|uniref:NADPH-dependent oxidoreductase n=1 Tax=Gordonia sp. DT101 TaxID=3416545 RepID=UPI003CE905D0
MATAVVVGNPKPASRTLTAATCVATELSGAEPDVIVDLATLGAAVLDRFAGGTGLSEVAIRLMLGGSPAHSLSPELTLRPVLTEIGGTVPGRALYVVDSAYEDPQAYAEWPAETRPTVTALLGGRS